MTRLIDAEKLKEALKSNCKPELCHDINTAWCEHCCRTHDFEDLIDEAPTVEEEDRPHGEWEPMVEENGTPYWEEYYKPMFLCTRCKCKSYKKPFCPHCGADMRGDAVNLCDDCRFADDCNPTLAGRDEVITTKCSRYERADMREADT